MEDDWREFKFHSFIQFKAKYFKSFDNKKLLSHFSAEKLDEEEIPPPKVPVAELNKWAGEDEDDDIKVS